MGFSPRLFRKPEIQVAEHARRGELPDTEALSPAGAFLLQRTEAAPDLAELARDPVGPLVRLWPHRIFVAHENGRFEDPVPQRLQSHRLPAFGSRPGKQGFSAVQAVE